MNFISRRPVFRPPKNENIARIKRAKGKEGKTFDSVYVGAEAPTP